MNMQSLPKLPRMTTQRIVGLSLLFTGLFYPLDTQYIISGQIVNLVGFGGLWVACALMVTCGLIMALKEHTGRRLFILLLPMLFIVMVLMIEAFTGGTLTAMVYYLSLWLIPIYIDYRKQLMQTPTRFVELLARRWQMHQMLGSLLLIMAVMMAANPYGVGLSRIYELLGLFIVNPPLFYIAIFFIGGTLALQPTIMRLSEDRRYISLMILLFPMILHGSIFIIHIVFKSGAWSLLPLFVGNTMLWLNVIERISRGHFD